MDFTLRKYKELIQAIQKSGYEFQTFGDFIEMPLKKVVVLRHDSDIWPKNDLRMAQLERDLGVRSTYYFRIPETFHLEIITKIKELNHEIGYHYEELARYNGDKKMAITNFAENLKKIRAIYPVKTVARHGRPLSKYDSLDLWKEHSLNDFNLTGEPYLSVDYSKVLYLTDNGSKWNAGKDNIRDKVKTDYDFNIRSSDELILNFKNNKLPAQIIINAHPARWNDNFIIWSYRFVLQKLKNFAKYFLNKTRN